MQKKTSIYFFSRTGTNTSFYINSGIFQPRDATPRDTGVRILDCDHDAIRFTVCTRTHARNACMLATGGGREHVTG